MKQEIPLPPLRLRSITGDSREESFNNPTGRLIWGDFECLGRPPDQVYEAILDFGCGCGRQARQLMLQESPPSRYLGVDVSPELIDWCHGNLTPCDPHFTFRHHNVFSATYAPQNDRVRVSKLPAETGEFTLFNAHSVFTHLHWDQSEFYLKEAKRILKKWGVIRATWLFIDKKIFPQMNQNQHCVYIQEKDPTQAVFYDIDDTFRLFKSLDLAIVKCNWTKFYGKPNELVLGRASDYQDISASLEIPNVIVGSDASETLLASHFSGWRLMKGEELQKKLQDTPGVDSVRLDIANAVALVSAHRDQEIDRTGIIKHGERYGFRVDFI